MKSLDLSKFKKMRTEKDHTVLQHPEGHEIRILHSKLSPKMKQQLDAIPHFAKGGEDQALPKEDRTEGFNKAKARGVSLVHHQLHGKENYAHGGHVENPKLEQSHVKDKAPKMEVIKKENYADGGLADTAAHFVRKGSGQESIMPPPKPEESLEEKNERIREQNTRNMEPGGYKLAEGGKVDPYQQAASDISKSIPADKAKQIAGAFSKGGGVHLHFYADGSEQPVSSMDQSPADAFVKGLDQNQTPMQDSAPKQEQSVPQTAPEAPIAPIDQNAPPKGTLQEQALADVEAQNKAEMGAAQNISKAAGKEADIYGQQAEQMQQLHEKYNQIGNDLHQKFDNISDEVAKTKIDPNHWFTSQSAPSQILTSIGMLFSGALMGVSGHPEMAQKTIDNVIDRDIQSQKDNIQNKQTLLGKYMDMYNSLPQAEAAARLTMEAGVEGLIKQQASKLNSQNATLAAQQTIAARRQALLPQMEQLAKGQAMMGMYQDLGKPQGQSSSQEQSYQDQMQRMRILNPDLGKDMQDKYLPGVGVSRVPIPDALREKIIAQKDLSDKLAKLENFAREHQGTVLNREIVNQGKTLAADAQQAARVAGHQGVYKESDQKFLETMIDPDPTKMFANVRTIPRYQQLRKSNDSTIQQYYKGYGIKPFNDAGQTATMNGVQYRKVPGGWEKVK